MNKCVLLWKYVVQGMVPELIFLIPKLRFLKRSAFYLRNVLLYPISLFYNYIPQPISLVTFFATSQLLLSQSWQLFFQLMGLPRVSYYKRNEVNWIWGDELRSHDWWCLASLDFFLVFDSLVSLQVSSPIYRI